MKFLKYLLPLFAVPLAFAAAPNTTLTPIDIVWFITGFCVFVILLILHHMTIEHDLKIGKKKGLRISPR